MAQRPRALQPELSALHLLGARLRTLREDRGLSQNRLGEMVFCSGHLIGKVEKGERRPQPDLIRRCDEALNAHGSLLLLASKLDNDSAVAIEPEHHAVLDSLPLLRRILDAHDVPEDGPVRSLPELRADVTRLIAWRLDSNYVALANHLHVLLPELQRLMQSSEPGEAASLLTQAYRAADAIADKFGLFDLSARIIELMRSSAATSGDPLTVAAGEYVRAETFFATGDWAAGRRVLERAASLLSGHSVDATAILGTLHMRAAILAARASDHAAASMHMDEATRVSRLVPEGIYRGTAFGPASVCIHRLSLALDSHDIDTALRTASGWTPPASVPAERRSHFFVDLARTQIHAARDDEALRSLYQARQIAPQHIRHHVEVKNALAGLLARTPRPSSPLLDLSRWTGLIPAPN